MSLKNDLLLRAARGQATERTPVWLMRQAGRILKEYREVRQRVGGFKELVEHPEFAAEVTIQPVDLLGVDAAIIFSDILVIPEAMGLSYQVIEAKGPTFEQTVRSKSDIEKLRVAGPEHLSYVLEAIRITKRELHDRVPLIGFAGAPWTILAYMVEGKGSKTFSVAKKFLYTEPALAHALLEKITESTIQYLKAQIAAGANLVQLFDSWAGLLSPDQYREFSLRYLEAIAAAITEVPVTIFAKGAFFARKEIAATNCSVIGLDWNMDIQESRALIGDAKTLQGNMDPCLLYAEDSVIVHETHRMLEAFGPFRHIANLGHGLYPDTDPRKVKLFIDTVKNFRFKV
ncbi:MAG: uroporphyrinogen decarboxylase [Candidatus Pollutiaquabacter aromativorans]|jgi:uroporphyrinogen decarboxylase|uniref:uroporphyrinogen decarboxylase n=1 Tax=Candidatus Pollutiaquabacter sp. TaxID=3416354 RepID=UPI003BF676A8|nr:uroporphyrinogen decarboxylase [Bacteroidota bacterium]